MEQLTKNQILIIKDILKEKIKSIDQTKPKQDKNEQIINNKYIKKIQDILTILK